MLRKKLWRTMWQYKAQFISMIIMIALGIGVFIGFNMEWYSIEKNLNYVITETGFADYRLMSEQGFTIDDLNKIIQIDGVDKATRYLSINTQVEGDSDIIALTVSTNINVSGFIKIAGEDYDETSTNGIWISDKYAEKNNVKLNDDFSLIFKGQVLSGKILGFVKSGEYLICLPDPTRLMPNYNSYGFAYISPAMLNNVMGLELDSEEFLYNQINVISKMDKKAFIESVNYALGKTTLVLTKDETISYSEAMGEATEGKTTGSILPVLFLAIAILTMITTMHRLTTNEKIQIGTLKSLGFKDKTIKRHYTSYALFIGVIGSIIGIALGYGIAYYIMNPYGAMGTYLDFPTWNLYMPWFGYLVIIAINILLIFVGYLSVRKMLLGSASSALRPYVPKRVKNLKIEKTKIWNKFSFGTKWNLRDIFRHKSRSFMTLFGVFGCVVLLAASFGMQDTMNAFVDVFYHKAINYESVISIDVNDDIEINNNNAKEIYELYNGDWAAKTKIELDDKAISLEIYNLSHDYVKFVDGNLNVISLKDNGAYVCERVAKDNSIKIGDNVTFSPYGTNTSYTVTIYGIINSMTEGIIMTDTYADSVGIVYKINTVYTNVTDVDTTGANIQSVQTKSDIIDSFGTFMEILNLSVILLVLAAVILGLIVLYNLGVMSYVERYRELATLKVVGFKDKQIGKILIGQNLWITILGIIIGLPAGIGVLSFLLNALAGEYEMVLVVGWKTFVISIIATFLVSFFISWILSKKNKKINMVEALKGAE